MGSEGDGTQREILSDKVGGKEEVEVKVGSQHAGVYTFQRLDALALFNHCNATLGTQSHINLLLDDLI